MVRPLLRCARSWLGICASCRLCVCVWVWVCVCVCVWVYVCVCRDADYIDKIGETRQQLYDLILAANYMDIKSLLHLGCAKVASLIKGQPLEKIKEILDPNQGKKDDKKVSPTNQHSLA